MWFNGDNRNLSTDPGYGAGFGFATSADAVDWQPNNHNPIDFNTLSPTGKKNILIKVVKLGGLYHFFYLKDEPGGRTYYHAVSRDGIQLSENAPIAIRDFDLVAATVFTNDDSDRIAAILHKADSYYMAISLDGINFSISNIPITFNNPLFSASDVVIEGRAIKIYGTISYGNINWNYGNIVIGVAVGQLGHG